MGRVSICGCDLEPNFTTKKSAKFPADSSCTFIPERKLADYTKWCQIGADMNEVSIFNVLDDIFPIRFLLKVL